MAFSAEKVPAVLVFFAGSTGTAVMVRLVFVLPADAGLDDLALRWDDFTGTSAKHRVFLMDACYGGFQLHAPPIPAGYMRFLKGHVDARR